MKNLKFAVYAGCLSSLALLPSVLTASSQGPFSEAFMRVPDLSNGERVFGYCVKCHGPGAWGKGPRGVPQTAGQHATVVIKQLGDIHAGNRRAERMIPYARPDLLGGAQGIADVAGHLSRLPVTPNPMTGPGDELGYGGALYRTYCAHLCHGRHGEGDARTRKPRVQGQHFSYLLRQLQHIRDGVRRNANAAMVRRLQGMTDGQLQALADFLSRLHPSDAQGKAGATPLP